MRLAFEIIASVINRTIKGKPAYCSDDDSSKRFESLALKYRPF